MILGLASWARDFAGDFINRIFITMLDSWIYTIIGWLYQVFLMIGTFDLFGGVSDGTEATMLIYQEFTKRIYSVLGLIVMFILAYQIILFVIDPDKGLKDSKKLVINIVKGIVLTILAPLIFHYLAQIQYHVLVSDNLIWNITLGEGKNQNDSVVEAGNSMTTMLYISMFHPVGTSYDSFYDDTGALKPYSEACSGYEGGAISDNALANLVGQGGGFGVGAAIGATLGPVGFIAGGIIGGIAGSAIVDMIYAMKGNNTSVCQYYYYKLYAYGMKSGDREIDDVKDVESITKPGAATASYRNMAYVLAFDRLLADHVSDEGDMEYYYWSPVAGAAVLFFMIGYVLDIAYRAFKLAFLEMVAPIPILLGTIPKNEKIYTQWKDSFIKTYIDIFVRVFIMSFIVLLIKLIPAFATAMLSVLTSSFSNDSASFPLKTLACVFMIVGLLKFGRDLPKMLSDVAKNSSGILSGIPNLDPRKNAKQVLGFSSGAALGAAAGGFRTFKNSDRKGLKKGLDTAGGALRGIVAGGKAGAKNGFGKGMLTKTVNEAQGAVHSGVNKRNAFLEKVGNGDVRGALHFISNGRVSKFQSAFRGDSIEHQEYYSGASEFQKVGNAGKGLFNAGIDAFKSSLDDEIAQSLQNGVSGSGFGIGNKFYAGTAADISNIKTQALTDLNSEYRSKFNEVQSREIQNQDGSREVVYNGKVYKSADGSDAAITQMRNDIRDDIMKDMNYQKRFDKIDNLSADDFVNTHYEFGGKTFSGDYETVRAEMEAHKKALVKNKEIKLASSSVGGVNGMEMLKQFAIQTKDAYNQWGDVLEPEQRDLIEKNMEKTLLDGISSNADFKQILNLDQSSFRDINAVMDRLSSDDFKERYKSAVENMSKDDKEALNKVIGATVRQVATDEADISTNSRKLKDLGTGAVTNRWTGQVENSLADSPKSDNK